MLDEFQSCTQFVATQGMLGVSQYNVAYVRRMALLLRPAVVTLDGPAASGKSTIGGRLGTVLNYLFFDTGVMYRAATVAALERKLDIDDDAAIAAMVAALAIDVTTPDGAPGTEDQAHVLVDGLDVTRQLRAQRVNRTVSVISAISAVRNALSAQQRLIALRYGSGDAERPGIAMAGRDIGTVVVPEARFKVFLDASVEERARRRYIEQVAAGDRTPLAAVRADIQRRDRLDSERYLSPLRAAEDAHVIDTTNLSATEVVARIIELFAEHVAPIVADQCDR